jgi:predicted choloylglycine hydrolase
MCTTLANTTPSGSWLLGKTRDPVSWMRWDDEIKLFQTPTDRFKKLIVQNPDPHQDGYYGGINNQGVAFVATYVHVAENQISYIRRPYVRLILEASTAKEAVKIIKAFNPKIGGNMFVADPKHCFGIEGAPDQYFIENINKASVKTNHFLHLPHRNLGFDTETSFEAWSHAHQARAEALIANAHTIEQFQAILKDRYRSDQNQAICTTKAEDPCFTHSAFVFDTAAKTASYAQGNPFTTPFKQYNFN